MSIDALLRVTLSYRDVEELLAECGLDVSRGLRKNNQAENSHQLVRRRERKLQGFKWPGSAQRFLSMGLAFVPEGQVRSHIADRTLVRILESWCPLFPGYHPYYPQHRQFSRAFRLLVVELRQRG
jgi:DNA-binding transcriptional LysR family regulator